MMSGNSEKLNSANKNVLPPLSHTLSLQQHQQQQQNNSKNKQFFHNITLFGNEFSSDRDRDDECIYENLFSGYGKLRKYDENIYENICENCGRLYNVSKCEFCEPEPDDEHNKKETFKYSNKFQEFFGNFRIKSSSSSNLKSKLSVFSSSSTSTVKRKFSKGDIVHNVNGFDDVFKTNKSFDLQEICQMKNEKLGKSDDYLVKKSEDILVPLKSRSFSDHLADLSDDKSENIYENLNYNKFDLLKHLSNDTTNDALTNWMMSLFYETDDYIDDVVYFVKSIPSKTFSDYSSDSVNELTIEEHFDYTLMIEEFQQNLLNNQKKREDELDVIEERIEPITITVRDQVFEDFIEEIEPIPEEKSEFVSGLLNIFEAVLNREKHVNQTPCDVRSEQTKVLSVYKQIPINKKHLRQQNLLLSVSLNKIIITYDKYLKLFLMINERRNGGETMLNVDYFRRFLENNYSVVVVSKRRRRKLFSDFLKISLKTTQKRICDFEVRNQKMVDDHHLKIDGFMREHQENIYQPIWKCKTQGDVEDDDEDAENIYDEVKIVHDVEDELEWEVDDEFSFSKKQNHQAAKKHPDDFYKEICILHDKNNPNLNKIIYNYKRDYDLNVSKDEPKSDECVSDNKSSKSIHSYSSYSIPDCVQFWKFMLLNVNYLEDEEDVIMTDKTIATINQKIETENTLNEAIKSSLLEKQAKLEAKIVKEDVSVSPLSFGSRAELKGDFLIDRGPEGVYRSNNAFQSNDSLSNLSDKSDKEEKPPQKRERFRDKLLAKFNDKDKNDGIVFGVELENVELDEKEGVPKFVIECIRILNDNENIQTHGIYRASGNKNTIESIKKKLNEKRTPKKYEFLMKQEVHTLTGALKLFFRELKAPLIPNDIFTACTERLNSPENLENIKENINKINSLNYITLAHLIRHLKIVDQNSDANMMTSSNLAIVWGACLFASSLNLMESYENNDLSKINTFVKRLIDNYQFIFC